jgi:hypothetical protein
VLGSTLQSPPRPALAEVPMHRGQRFAAEPVLDVGVGHDRAAERAGGNGRGMPLNLGRSASVGFLDNAAQFRRFVGHLHILT